MNPTHPHGPAAPHEARPGPATGPSRTMSLRTALAAAAVGLSLLGLLASGVLLVLVRQTAHTADHLRSYDRSMDAAERMRLALLLANREGFLARVSPGEGHDRHASSLRAELEQSFAAAEAHVVSEEERRILLELRAAAAAVFASLEAEASGPPLDAYRRTSAILDDALRVADEFVAINRAQAAEAVRAFEQWQRTALASGAVVSVTLPVLVIAILLALRRLVLRPIGVLEAAIARYAGGDHDARAPREGPTEIRTIARQFDEMAEALESQRHQQLTFLAAVAHDLRNPLAALRTAAAVAEREAAVAPERLGRRLEMMDRQVERLNRLVGDLLDVTRVEAGQFELHRERADLRDAVREVAHLFEGSSPKHRLEVQLPEEPVIASHDPLRIGQVLNNLVSNAIKYSPEGGPVRLSLHTEGPRAIVAVADRGIGMTADDRARLFQPFRRGASVQESIPGVGLGLSASCKLVLAHGGTIEVESEPGAGSTFRVQLPLS